MSYLATPLSWIEISQSAIIHNIREIRKLVGQEVQIFSCVKANAYGHGLLQLTKILAEADIDGFAVTDFEEALTLRDQGIQQPIQVMSPLSTAAVGEAARHDLWVWIHDMAAVNRIEQELADQTQKLSVVVKVDTGMGRLGIAPAELEPLLRAIQQSSHVQVVSVASHFATADLGGALFQQQKANFAHAKQLTAAISGDVGIAFQCANSAAILRDAATHGDMVRPGLAMYGYWPAAAVTRLAQSKHIALQPALSWKTRLVQVKTLAAGANVGYGGKTQTTKVTKLGILPVGYAHGLGYRLSNRGEVLVGGQRVPILGNDCMNVTMIDITDVEGAQLGDEVVIIGKQGTAQQTAEDLAQAMSTMVYEVLVNLSPLLERRIIQ